MPRPAISDSGHATKLFTIKMTVEEYHQLRVDAAHYDMSMTKYLRRLIAEARDWRHRQKETL